MLCCLAVDFVRWHIHRQKWISRFFARQARQCEQRHGEGTFRGLMMIEMVISTEVENNGFMNNKKRRLGEQGMWIRTSFLDSLSIVEESRDN